MLLQSAKRWLAAAVFFQTIAVTLTSIAQQPVRDIGSRRELFIDDWLIDTQTNVALTLHPAVPREVVLELSQAWAGPTTGFTAVMRDRDRFRFYYSNDSDGATKDATSYAESLDGFASLRALPTGGEVTTHALRFDGTRLSLNFQTSATGSLRVAVLKPDGTAYPEFEAASCMEMYGNDLDRTVTWKGKSDLRELVGKTVRLRFFLQNADLYALQFVK